MTKLLDLIQGSRALAICFPSCERRSAHRKGDAQALAPSPLRRPCPLGGRGCWGDETKASSDGEHLGTVPTATPQPGPWNVLAADLPQGTPSPTPG